MHTYTGHFNAWSGCMMALCFWLYRYGSWGVCFTYAGWFGIKGLVAAGRTYEDCSSIRKACDFLLSKELPSGGWGESYLSCQNKVNDSSNLKYTSLSFIGPELTLFLYYDKSFTQFLVFICIHIWQNV